MAHEIITQPNGKYCIFSTVVDNVTDYNCTIDEVIEAEIEYMKDVVRSNVLSQIKANARFNYEIGRYNNAIQTISDNHGEDEALRIKSLIESNNNNNDKR